MTLEEIEWLIRRLDRSDIAALTVCDETASLTLRVSPVPRGGGAALSASPLQAGAASEAPDAAPVLRAPSIGHLRLRHPGADPGEDHRFPRSIRRGDIVAFLECGAVLRPVLADRDGTIGAPQQADGALVGFGTPLFGFI